MFKRVGRTTLQSNREVISPSRDAVKTNGSSNAPATTMIVHDRGRRERLIAALINGYVGDVGYSLANYSP